MDVNSAFVNGGHRWCENPNAEFHEPDASRADTYFFLSSWSDIGIGGAADVSETTSQLCNIFVPPNLLLPLFHHPRNLKADIGIEHGIHRSSRRRSNNTERQHPTTRLQYLQLNFRDRLRPIRLRDMPSLGQYCARPHRTRSNALSEG